jgi:hypothetical protein
MAVSQGGWLRPGTSGELRQGAGSPELTTAAGPRGADLRVCSVPPRSPEPLCPGPASLCLAAPAWGPSPAAQSRGAAP